MSKVNIVENSRNTKISETITENLFRDYYGNSVFLEKSAIPAKFGFKSKKKTSKAGYPDFFLDTSEYAIVVEAKALLHSDAEKDVQFYMMNNLITKGIIGMAVSGQYMSQIKVTYFLKRPNSNEIEVIKMKNKLMSLENIDKTYRKKIAGEIINNDELTKVIKHLNEKFNKDNKVRSTDCSLFFSGILIALRNKNFRSTYLHIQEPSETEKATTLFTLIESYNLNKLMLEAIDVELKEKVNNLSKEFSWKDRFSFILNIDFSLVEYKNIISLIEEKVFIPFINEEKQDVLGKAYNLFLQKVGKIESKNIILTPDHIKSLMVKLADLEVDDVVLDTCMGSGGFLMESLETLVNLAGDNQEKIDEICTSQLIGFENDPVLFALACSNMFLHGDGRSNLLYRSSLLYDSKEVIVNNLDDILLDFIKNKKPNKCIINPPYEQDNPIRFLKQALDYLEPHGKLIIIIPTPTLAKHKKENGLTHDILAMAHLDFVIKMPLNLFSEQGRTVNTSIFGFTKVPHKKMKETVFYQLNDDGFQSIQHKGRVDKDNRWNDYEATILDAINNHREINNVCSLRQIYKNDILNVSGWKDITKSKGYIVKFSELFKIEKGNLASNSNDQNGIYDFITASNERKKHSSYTHDCEALVYAVAASGSLGKSQYINNKFSASNLCLILSPLEDSDYLINLQFYNWYLESIREQVVSDLADGTSKLVIQKTDLEDYYIEYFPIAQQEAFVSQYINPYLKVVNEL